MGGNRWIGGLALFLGLTTWTKAEAQPPNPSVRVLLTDIAGIPEGTLGQAKHEVTRLFERSRISLVWIDAGECHERCLFVRTIAKPIGTKGLDNPLVVGVAPGTREARGRFAWVFYDRVRIYSAELGLSVPQMLGHVIAHELGHLLLPHGAHSVAGVMRAGWDRAQVKTVVEGLVTFTPDQAALIRERLQASASPIAHAR